MAPTIKAQLSDVHPQMLRAEHEGAPQLSGKHAIGLAIERALGRANFTKQEAAFRMGYTDSGVIGRWIAGTETPQFAKLWTLGDAFRRELVIAQAEVAGIGIDVQTVITVRRSA